MSPWPPDRSTRDLLDSGSWLGSERSDPLTSRSLMSRSRSFDVNHGPLSVVAVLLCAVSLGFLLSAMPLETTGVAVISVAAAGSLGALHRLRKEGFSQAEWALGACVVLLPMTPLIDGATGRGTAIRLVLAGWVSFLVISNKHARRHLPILPTTAIVAMALALSASAATAAGSTYGVVRLINWLMFVPVAFVVMSRNAERLLVLAGLTLLAVLLGGAALQLAGVLSGTWGGLALDNGENALRLTSVLLNPNDLGLLSAVIAMGAIAYGSGTSGLGRLLSYLAAAGGLVLLLSSGSRGAMLVLIAFSPILLWTVASRRTAVPVAVAVGLVALAAYLAPPIASVSAERAVRSVPGAVRGEDVSAAARKGPRSLLATAPRNAFLGNGFGGYSDILGLRSIDLSGRRDANRALPSTTAS